MMQSALLVVASMLLFAHVHAIKYTDCGSAKGTVRNVQVTGCENEDVCPLKRGTTPEITIDFTPKEDSTSMKAVVHGVIAGVPMPFPLPQPNACQNSGIACPVNNGNSYIYKQTLPVRNSYPPLDVKVKWELKDASGADIVCVLIPSRVV